MRLICAAFIAATLPQAATAEIVLRAVPGDFVYIHDASKRHGYVDLMLQTIVITNAGRGDVQLAGLEFDYRKDGRSEATVRVTADNAVADTAEYAAMAAEGFDAFVRAQLLTEGGLEALAGDGATLSTDAVLGTGESLFSTANYAALPFEPDEVVVTALYGSQRRRLVKSVLSLGARRAAPAIQYAFPLDGAWLMRSLPSLQGHHRSIPSNEFALDFFKPGAEGRFAEGDSRIAENNYGYGAPVRAAAAGEVAFVIDDATQDRAALSRRDGESTQEAARRIGQYTMSRIAADFRKALAGNLVTIRHERDGAIEYSSYGHLKAGSVRVKTGDRVALGDIIGEVGDTGDSAAVHLHFQVNEGADAFFSRSKPVTLTHMSETFAGQDPGIFVRAADRD